MPKQGSRFADARANDGFDMPIARIVAQFREKTVTRQRDLVRRRGELLQAWTYVERYRRKRPTLPTKDVCLELATRGGFECLRLLSDGTLQIKLVEDWNAIYLLYRQGGRLAENDAPLALAMENLMRRNSRLARAWRDEQRRSPLAVEDAR
jgi:hypothetical protein